VDMDLLTLSRYILESSLLHSQFSIDSDSLVASAALWLASCMSKKAEERAEQIALWTTALQHYTGLFCYKYSFMKRKNTEKFNWIFKKKMHISVF
jgi:Cyclin, C-terminal domain